MTTLLALACITVPLLVTFGAGYLLGLDVAGSRDEEARWDAFDKALDSGTDDAFEVYYAAYPRETK